MYRKQKPQILMLSGPEILVVIAGRVYMQLELCKFTVSPEPSLLKQRIRAQQNCRPELICNYKYHYLMVWMGTVKHFLVHDYNSFVK